MRERIFREHGSDEPWNLKHARGGMLEIEFCAQFLQLAPCLGASRAAFALDSGRARGRRTLRSWPAADTAEVLLEALHLHHGLLAVLRLSLSDRFDPAEAPEGLRLALVRAASEDPRYRRRPPTSRRWSAGSLKPEAPCAKSSTSFARRAAGA